MPRPYRLSPEGRAKMSAARKAEWAAAPERRAKMSETLTAAWADPERNPLAGLTQEQRRVYDSLRHKGCSREAALVEARRPVLTCGAA